MLAFVGLQSLRPVTVVLQLRCPCCPEFVTENVQAPSGSMRRKYLRRLVCQLAAAKYQIDPDSKITMQHFDAKLQSISKFVISGSAVSLSG